MLDQKKFSAVLPFLVPLNIVAVVVLGLLIWNFWPQPKPEVGQSVPAKLAPELVLEPTVDATPKKIKTYRPKVKQELNLPASAIGNQNEQVVAAAKVKPDDRPHTVTTTVDLQTGEFRSYDRPDPLPWLARDTKTVMGVFVGYKQMEPAVRVEVSQHLLQVKAIHFVAKGTYDYMLNSPADSNTLQKSEWFVGVGAELRF